jgi:hypothetical protein
MIYVHGQFALNQLFQITIKYNTVILSFLKRERERTVNAP